MAFGMLGKLKREFGYVLVGNVLKFAI